jgi:D-alanyl-D-alanine carboxypeptidase
LPLPAPPPSPPAIVAKAAVVIDGDTGQILYQRNPHQRLPQASTTKFMTALVAAENGQANSYVPIASHSSEIGGSSMYLDTGETLTIEQLLYGLLLVSGNDAADAIATGVAGSTADFVARMNERAAALGLKDTRYANPHGLPDEGHFSSAFDMAILGRTALANNLVSRIAGTREIELPGNRRTKFVKRHLVNHNKLLGWFPGAWGGKTGYTNSAGRCFIGSARRDGRYVIEAILGSPKLWQDAASLLNYGIDAFRTTQVAAPNTAFGMVHVVDGEESQIAAILPRAARVTLPAGQAATGLETKAELRDGIQAPVRLGEQVGRLVISQAGKPLAEFPLVAAAGVERAPAFGMRMASALGWFLCGGLLSLGVFTLLRMRQLRRKAKLRARRQKSAGASATASAPSARLVKAASAATTIVR